MFIPEKIYYEEAIQNYELGKRLMEQYKNIPKTVIQNHNNIEEMRKKDNSEFAKIKRNLIIGIRKTHRYVINHKVSDFLVPYTSSGCTAMCMYCYLVCNFNKCSYLRLFVNREEMLNKIIKKANESDKDYVFEIGSNSDLVLENTITNNLEWTIEQFKKSAKGKLTFPTKFDMVEPILNLDHQGKIIVRVSVNPEEIIQKVEFGTSRLTGRIKAINQLVEAGYTVGIIVAPIILIEEWKKLYTELLEQLSLQLTEKAKKQVFFEFIFMTYSYIHKMINHDAFPNTIELLNPQLMKVRGRGKYTYQQFIRKEGEDFFREKMHQYFPNNAIIYFS